MDLYGRHKAVPPIDVTFTLSEESCQLSVIPGAVNRGVFITKGRTWTLLDEQKLVSVKIPTFDIYVE